MSGDGDRERKAQPPVTSIYPTTRCATNTLHDINLLRALKRLKVFRTTVHIYLNLTLKS